MIQRQKDGFVAIKCDACGETDETYASFHDAWALFHRLGWRARQVGDDWAHDCPECARSRSPARDERSGNRSDDEGEK